MKSISIWLSFILCTFFVGVIVAGVWIPITQNNPINKTTNSTVTTVIENKLNTKEVIEAFKTANLPIDKIVFRTTETDFENLLGKPNQYIEKADWIDIRIKENSRDNHVGGVIEIFESTEALEKRNKQIEEIEKATGIENYRFIHKNVILRLDSVLTTKQAADYEEVLKRL